jgi:hypothetical protein
MAIADGSGDIIKDFGILVHKGTPAASTAITKGQVLVNQNGEGWNPSTTTDTGPFGVALEDAASAASPSAIKILLRGVVRVTAGAAVDEGEWVIPHTGGEVKPFGSPAGTGNLKQIIGMALEDISATAAGKVLLGY